MAGKRDSPRPNIPRKPSRPGDAICRSLLVEVKEDTLKERQRRKGAKIIYI
jgi:hypothetical protein